MGSVVTTIVASLIDCEVTDWATPPVQQPSFD